MDKIVIDKLKIDAVVGIYDWERNVPQELVLDVLMEMDIRKAAQSQHIDDALDYEKVCNQLESFIQDKKFELLETLVEESANYLFDNFPIQKLRLRCMKTQVMKETAGVGVEIEREA